jgi:hypothetical protein
MFRVVFCFVDDFNARDDFLGGTIILLLTNAQFCLILFVRLCLRSLCDEMTIVAGCRYVES